jgi:hypothetical protein
LIVVVLAASRGNAGSFSVDRFDDAVDAAPGDGSCAAVDGGCALRAAVMEANALGGNDEIHLPIGTFRLTLGSGPSDESRGDLDLAASVSLVGAGRRETVIEAASGERVLELHAGSSILSALTLRGGTAAGNGGGLMVQAAASLTCTLLLVRDNRATGGGGGVAVAAGGHVECTNTIIAANLSGGDGGGVWSAGDVTLTDSRVTRNRSLGGGGGLAGSGAGSALTLPRSAVDRNVAAAGGGVAVVAGSLSVLNSTLSSNRSAGDGGGVHLSAAASAEIISATVAGNLAAAAGGGVWLSADSALAVGNLILADNSAASGADCSGTLGSSFGHNLVEDLTACTLTGTLTGNLTGQDPGLLPLANYGGPTPTQELASKSSPAWDAGNDSGCLFFDQRLHPRPRGAHCDIGATEFFGLVPVDLAADPTGNGVLDPTFGNNAIAPTLGSLLDSATSANGILFLSGPADDTVNYALVDSTADYGSIDGGFAQSCTSTANCYIVNVAPAAGDGRPVRHWDLAADEALPSPLRALWRVHAGQSFTDAPTSQAFYRSIETLLHNEVTAGCVEGRFCPAGPLSRSQLALLLERSAWGEFPLPFVATGSVFADVPVSDPFAPWIERLAADGVAAGCSGDPDGAGPALPRFCPGAPVRRDQLALFVVRMRMGASFVPPACDAQTLADVSPADAICPWVRAALNLGFLHACAPDPDGAGPLLARYCPANPATRASAAGAFASTFGLELWSLGGS